MHNDEEEIRQLVSNWMAYTKAGHVDAILDLMTQDVVFLVPGRLPMGKSEFAAMAHAQAGKEAPQIDGSSKIQEIKIEGKWAFAWAELSIVVKPDDGKSVTRSGHTLTIFRKEGGKWLLARDANLLVTVQNDKA